MFYPIQKVMKDHSSKWDLTKFYNYLIIWCISKINFYLLDTTYLSSFICYSTFTTFSSSSTHLLMSLYIIVLEKNFEKKPNLYGNMSKKSCAVALIHEFTSHRYMIMRYEILYLVLSNMRMCWAENWITVVDKKWTQLRATNTFIFHWKF